MKKLTALAATAAVALVGQANAALLDLTDRDNVSKYNTDNPVEIKINGLMIKIFGVPTAVTSSESSNTAGLHCADQGGMFACESDGIGIDDDEITGDSEQVTITFSAPVELTAAHVLDLFTRNAGETNPDNIESAKFTLFLGAAEVGSAELFAMDQTGTTPGFMSQGFLPTSIDRLVFTVGTGDDRGAPDYAIAGIEFLSNNISESIPVPGALPLFVAGLAGLRFARRRAKA